MTSSPLVTQAASMSPELESKARMLGWRRKMQIVEVDVKRAP
jgi:hypothetical protein